MENKSTVVVDTLISLLLILLLSTIIVMVMNSTTIFDYVISNVALFLYIIIVGRHIMVFLREYEIMKNRLKWYDKREGERMKVMWNG